MAEQINALLVHAKDQSYADLTLVLESLSLKVVHAQSCREASVLLKRQDAIDLIFTGTNLKDGGWADVLALAQRAKSYLPVIVVSQSADPGLYLESIGRGAFELVTPPFQTSDLALIVRSAIDKELNSMKRKKLTAPPAP